MYDKTLTIDYTNYRGVRRIRRVEPLQWRFGTNDHHRNAQGVLVSQWFLFARDIDREGDVRRDFALSGIHGFGTASSPPVGALPGGVDVPAPGTEERDFWLEAAEQHGFEYPTEFGMWCASADAVLKLMAAAREQGRRDHAEDLKTNTQAFLNKVKEQGAILGNHDVSVFIDPDMIEGRFNLCRDDIARVLETIAKDGLPGPRDLDVALEAIMTAVRDQ